MALKPAKKTEQPKVAACNCEAKIETLCEIIGALTDRVEALESVRVKGKASIQKTEEFNGEVATDPSEYSHGMKMNFEDKLISMRNAIAILPPNLMEDGKHTQSNIGAICGFIVTDEMYELLYEDAT